MINDYTPPAAALDLARNAPSSRWAIVPLLMALSFISHFNRVSIATAGDTRIMKQYGISPTQMGTVYSAFLIVYTVCMIPGGLFIDRFSPRVALRVVGFGSAVFVALTGVVGLTIHDRVGAFVALLAVQGLMGVVSSPLHPALASAVGHWIAPGGRARTNGLVNGSALVGIAVAPLLFGMLIRVLDWPRAFFVGAAATAGIAAAWSWFVAEAPPEHGPHVAKATGGSRIRDLIGDSALWTNRSLILLTLSYAAVSYFQYLFFYWMTHYFKTVLKLPESQSQTYAAIPPLAMALGMPLGGWLSDRLERRLGPRKARRIVPMAGMTAGGVFLILGIFATEPGIIVTWLALALGAVGTAEGPFWVTAIELGGRRGGSSAAFFNMGGNAGGMIAPVLTPLVGDRYGWGYAVALGAGICLAGVLLWLGIHVSEDGTPETSRTPTKPASYNELALDSL